MRLTALLLFASPYLLLFACGSDDAPSTGGETVSGSSEAGGGSSSEASESEAGNAEATSATEEESGTPTQTDATSSSDTGDGESGESGDTGLMDCEGGPVLRALFLGNSYTAYNNLPSLVAEVACSAGYVLDYASVNPGGFTFGSHLTNAATLEAIESQDWDVVVLQNQSQLPGFPPAQVMEQSLPNAIALVDLIHANDLDTEILYFQTWGRIDGDTMNCASYPPICTFEGHTQALADGYAMYAEATAGDIAPVGFAWLGAVQDMGAPFDSAGLWSGDGSHPSMHGSYLTAAVFFASLYDESPEGLAHPDAVPASDAAFLQAIAADEVLGG